LLKGVIFIVLLFAGCGLKVNADIEQERLSCEEKAKAKSLQYLEQQYRCTAK